MSRHSLLEEAIHGELSLAEWFALEEDERGELVDSHLVEEEAPNYVHEILVIRQTRGGAEAGPPARSHRLLRGHSPAAPQRRHRAPPDIAIEIVSLTPRDGRRDREEKVADYAAFGVRYYWIVDPQLRSLEILGRSPQGRYEHLLGAMEGTVDIPGSDGFVLDLDALWAEIERFEAREASKAQINSRRVRTGSPGSSSTLPMWNRTETERPRSEVHSPRSERAIGLYSRAWHIF